jgi:hypothetical protein
MATHSASTSRALRVGVLLGDNLVEERLFTGTSPISIGQSLRCTLSIPVDGVPADHVLFTTDQGRILLRVTARMTGRLANGGTVRTSLTDGAGADGIWTIPLERGARGKLQIGDATILFQEVAMPPATPRPQLPASVRGSFADRIDRRLAVIVAGSLLVHLTIGTWAWMTERVGADLLADPLVAYEPPRDLDVIEMDGPDDPPPPTNAPDTPGATTPVSPRQTPAPIVARPRLDRLPEPEDPDRWAQMMTGNTTGPDGHDEIKQRMPGATLDKQIDDIRDRNREVRVGNNPTSRDFPVRRGTGPDGPVIDGPELDQIKKRSEEPIARLTPLPLPPRPPGERPTLTAAMVLARIQGSYMPGLKRCYVKHGLAHDAALVAKVTVSFVVDETGQSTENTASGANAEVDTCIRGQMNGWRFPVPKDKDGDPTDAPFKVQLALQPS